MIHCVKHFWKTCGVPASENTLEGVMGRNAIGQSEEPFQPVTPELSKGSDLLPIIGAAQHSAQSDDNNVDQQMQGADGGGADP